MKEPPLYQNLYDDLVKKIRDGIYSEKKPLPSERELCDLYYVSRSTVRKAMEKLRKDKYIKTVHGSGNYVSPKVYYQPLTNFHSFANYLAGNNVRLINQIIDYELITRDEFLDSYVKEDVSKKWHKLTRLRHDDDAPLMIETTYLPQNRFYKVDPDILGSHSLYKFLETYYNMKIDYANEIMTPILPNSEQASLLKISSKLPCMLLERACYENDSLIIIHKTIVRGDKYHFKNIYRN